MIHTAHHKKNKASVLKKSSALVLAMVIMLNCAGCSDEDGENLGLELVVALAAGSLALMNVEIEYPVSQFIREQAICRCIKNDVGLYIKNGIETGKLTLYREIKEQSEQEEQSEIEQSELEEIKEQSELEEIGSLYSQGVGYNTSSERAMKKA